MPLNRSFAYAPELTPVAAQLGSSSSKIGSTARRWWLPKNELRGTDARHRFEIWGRGRQNTPEPASFTPRPNREWWRRVGQVVWSPGRSWNRSKDSERRFHGSPGAAGRATRGKEVP